MVVIDMKNFYSGIIPLLSILSIYKSPLPQLDLGTLVAIGVFLVTILYVYKNRIRLTIGATVPLFLLYIFFLMAMNLIEYNNIVDSEVFIFRNIKFILLILGFYIIILANLVNFKRLMDIYVKIAVLSSIYIILQTCTYYILGIELPNVLYGYTASDLYVEIDYASLLYRPSSFFLEPAHYFQYNLIPLIYLLFSRAREDRYSLTTILLGIICSTSGQGYVITMILLILYCIFNYALGLRTWVILLICGIFVLSGVGDVGFLKVDVLEKSIGRFIAEDGSLGEAWYGRTNAYEYLYDMDTTSVFFGNGLGNITPGVYYSGIPYMINCIGILGTSIFVLYIIRMGMKGDKFTAILAFTYVGTLFIAQNFTALLICLYFSIITVAIGEGDTEHNFSID